MEPFDDMAFAETAGRRGIAERRRKHRSGHHAVAVSDFTKTIEEIKGHVVSGNIPAFGKSMPEFGEYA